MLDKLEIRDLIFTYGMISEYINLDDQLQVSGFDLTLKSIKWIPFGQCGTLDFDNSKRKLIEHEEEGCIDDYWILSQGKPYVLQFNEIINLPKNVSALTFPRSSLFRNGVLTTGAVWDAGYCGRGTNLIFPFRTINLYKNAKVCQMIFFKLENESEGYEGYYNKEGLVKNL